MAPEDIKPISAPLANPERMSDYDEPTGTTPQSAINNWAEEHAEAAQFMPAKGSAEVPRDWRLEMRISNRHNYMHFYTMPAYVGMNNVPQLIQAMQSEGCDLTDIQITFDARELK